MRIATLRRLVGAAFLAMLVGCGEPGLVSDDAAETTVSAENESSIAPSFDLPFGLEHVEGTTPIGRPMILDQAILYEEVPIVSRSLDVAYRVTAEDPVAVFHTWVEQLATRGLALDTIDVRSGVDPTEPWMTAQGSAEFVLGEPAGDHASVQLWATTGDEPILLVGASRRVDGADEPRPATVVDRPSFSDDPERSPGLGVEGYRGVVVDEALPSVGDELFTEQGDTIHLPEGARALVPVVPVMAGTGGARAILAAEDAEAVIQALLDQATALGEQKGGSSSGISYEEHDGTEVLRGSFAIPAGGWGFGVTSVRAPGDPWATVYVSTYAD
jgi:hypothetical protein